MKTLTRIGAIAMLAVVFLATQARAASYSVTNYSWLQLEPSRATASILGAGGATSGTMYAPISGIRWGDGLGWIPTPTFTASGTSDYSATIKLDASRDIKTVTVNWYASGGNTISNYFIQGSNDGTTFTTIASKSTGVFRSGAVQDSVAVTAGNYQYVRVLVPNGGYTTGSGFGGPGFSGIEPIGDGTLSDSRGSALINWANANVFGTTVSNNGLDFPGTGINNGVVGVSNAGRAGDNGAWEPGDYTQLDLKAVRPVSQTVVAWNDTWGAASYTVQYSLDGINFSTVTGASPTSYGDKDGAVGYTFDQVAARYIRISDVPNGGGYALLDQVMVFGAVPEPSSVLLLLAGGTLLWRRARRK